MATVMGHGDDARLVFRPALARHCWNIMCSLYYFTSKVYICMLCYPGLGQGNGIRPFVFTLP